MRDKIQDHFNDEEIIKLEIGPDMARWEQILKFHKKEIDFLSNLLSAQGSWQSKELYQKMETAREINLEHQQTFLDFKNNFENHRECDEMDCDIHYMKEYFVLKEMLTKYFDAYRAEKNEVYDYFKELSGK